MSKLDYKIPDDILAKIPDYFWPAFAGELVSVYDPFIFVEDNNGQRELFREIDFLTGTAAWAETFKATCKKLGIEWLNKYRNNLDWDESDLFDSDICDIMCKFVKEKSVSSTAYYDWLTGIKDSVAYICDEKACEHCIQDESRYCHHTTDIKHAVNFEEVAPGKYMEKILDDLGTGRCS